MTPTLSLALDHIEELKALRDGWLDGQGVALDAAGLDWLRVSLEHWVTGGLIVPRIYPTPEGGVFLEWSIGHWEPTLEIALSDKTAYWHDMNMSSLESEDRELDLNSDEAWAWVAEQLLSKATQETR